MIGKLSGRVAYVAEDHALIEAGDVGYVVHCAPRTLASLPAGGRAALYTELVVREDALVLYGFATLLEKEWHRLLTGVQGVGAKLSLAILGALGPEGVGRAVALGDATALKRAPGVGPKLAQRLALELKDKAPNVLALGARAAAAATPSAPTHAGDAPPADDLPAAPDDRARRAEAEADAMSALVNLGYPAHEASGAVARAAQTLTADPTTPEPDASALIKAALRALAERR